MGAGMSGACGPTRRDGPARLRDQSSMRSRNRRGRVLPADGLLISRLIPSWDRQVPAEQHRGPPESALTGLARSAQQAVPTWPPAPGPRSRMGRARLPDGRHRGEGTALALLTERDPGPRA